jgi:putative glutamine amidotransferase
VKTDWFHPVTGSEIREILMSRRRRDKLLASTVDVPTGPQPEPEVTQATLTEAARIARDNAAAEASKKKAEDAAEAEAAKRRVTVIKDHILKYPQLFLEIWFASEGHEACFGEMFARAGCSKAKSIDKADLVVFPGGADVNPKIYGQPKHTLTRFNEERDKNETEVFIHCLKNGIPMVGICRGAQFLHVMQGGNLYQHVNNHQSPHAMYDVEQGLTFERVPSTHHQMVRFDENLNMQVIAHSVGISNVRFTDPLRADRGLDHQDIEAVWYPNNCILTVQGHPEYMGFARYTNWFLKLIENKIVNEPRVRTVTDKGHSNYRFIRDVVLTDPDDDQGNVIR